MRLILADDHDLARAGIRCALAGRAGIEIVGEARSGEELVALAERERPHIALADISMPGMNGIAAIPVLRERVPDMRILMLSGLAGIEFVRRAVDQGACGYLLKDSAVAELPLAVENVMSYGSYFSPPILHALLAPAQDPTEGLTARQLEILDLIGLGKTTKEVARELGLSTKTIDVHRARIMQRTGVRTQPELVKFAVQARLGRRPELLA